jgi:hypothetical protein
MKFKKLLILLGVLSALGALSVLKQVRGPAEPAAELVESTQVGASFDVPSARRVDIHRLESERLAFVKDGSGGWSLASHFGTRVRKEPFESLLRDVSALRGELRAESADLFGDFSITEEKAIQIEVFGADDRKLAHVLLSARRPRGTQNFVRLAGSDRVFVTDTDLLASLSLFSDTDTLSHRAFADLRLTGGLEVQKVSAIDIAPPLAKSFSLVRKEEPKDAWAFDRGAEEPDPARINEFISSLNNLYAGESLDPAPHAKDFPGSAPWVRIRMKAGEKPESVELWLGAPSAQKKTRLVRVLPEGLVYEVPEPSLEAPLKRTRETFLKPKSA